MLLGKKKGSAKAQINIKEVREGILVLSGSRYRMILAVSSLNLDLQNEAEQDRIIDSYKNLLNSLTFPIQILMRVRQLDPTIYQEEVAISRSDTYQKISQDHHDFIDELVKENKILTRSFYVVITFSGKGLNFAKAKEELQLRRDVVVRGLETIGLRTNPLSTLEILLLFYHFYNELLAKSQLLQENTTKAQEVLGV